VSTTRPVKVVEICVVVCAAAAAVLVKTKRESNRTRRQWFINSGREMKKRARRQG
jgi:hypothetical protein